MTEKDDNEAAASVPAIHEAGHCVVAYLNGMFIAFVDILRDDIASGRMGAREQDATLVGQLATVTAGGVALGLWLGEERAKQIDGHEGDFELIERVLSRAQTTPFKSRQLLQSGIKMASAQLRHNWDLVVALARALDQRKILYGQEVLDLIAATKSQRGRKRPEKP